MEETSASEDGREIRRGLQVGFLSGLAAITCCVSPVVFVLLGIATAAEAVTLGDTLYYEYGWFFRAGGLAVAAAAVILYLRGRRACSIQRRVHVPADAPYAGRHRRGDLRRPVLVHEVPGHLVRIGWRPPAEAAPPQSAVLFSRA